MVIGDDEFMASAWLHLRLEARRGCGGVKEETMRNGGQQRKEVGEMLVGMRGEGGKESFCVESS